ncbi:MAG: LL-diaminopimelate aminotransferase [Elusimicrobia bacterium]|nr:LL-diaminopimelate aminotransferase [Elusimicrobiota bacterium]
MKIEVSEKLNKLPPYIFSRINQLKLEAFAKKLDVIDLGMGNPDMPTPSHIVDRLCDTVKNHIRTHRYPQAKGMPKFRAAVAEWFQERFDVKINPENEVLALIGSKEGVAHLCMTYLNPGDIALVPDPGYPVYYNGVALSGGEAYKMPLLAKNKFLPDLGKIPASIAKKAKIMFLNYPNNPTTAIVEDMELFKEVVRFAKKYNIIIIHDNAYSELTFDGYVSPSFLQVPGAMDVAVEYHSFSKTFSMAGWRVGFVVGNAEILKPVEKFKSFVDYGVPTFIQLSGVCALKSPKECIKETIEIYRRRRDKFVSELDKIGWHVEKPKATMYLWAQLPEEFKAAGSLKFSEALVKETGVATTPGIAFGEYGEGYVRFSLVTHDNRFHDAVLRIKKLLKSKKKGI